MKAPKERTETARRALEEALSEGFFLGAKELSARLGLSEKQVLEHLEHLRRTHKKRFRIESARCAACGHVFEGRERLTKPGRCPSCRATRIRPPRFSLV